MAEIPAPDSFYELSLVADRFIDKASNAIVFEIDDLAVRGFQDADLPGAARACSRLIEIQFSETLNDECKRTMEWLESEPAFAMAFKSL